MMMCLDDPILISIIVTYDRLTATRGTLAGLVLLFVRV